MIRILIGSNGGLTGIYLAKQYRKYEGIILFGADASENSTGRFFVNQQFILPPAYDNTFVDALIDLLNTYDIQVYL